MMNFYIVSGPGHEKITITFDNMIVVKDLPVDEAAKAFSLLFGLCYIYSVNYDGESGKGKGNGKGAKAKKAANISSFYQWGEFYVLKIKQTEKKENGRVIQKKKNTNVVKLMKDITNM